MDEQQRRLAEELLFSEKKKPSFAKKLYFGIFDPSLIFPFPQISSDKKNVADSFIKEVHSFAAKEIHGDQIDRNASIPASVIEGLGQMGVLGITIPQQYGGLGMPQYTYCKVAETIAQFCNSTALFINAHQSIGLKALLLFGTEEQKRKWLPALARGEKLAAFALTEPNAGSDASAVETKAIFDKLKNKYYITGNKQWITNGSVAGMLTLMAKTEVQTEHGTEQKITAFIVTPDMPGFHVKDASLEKVGMRGSITSNLEFKDLEVPAENVLGPLGGGLKVCLTVLDYGRTTFGATCTGVAKFLLHQALKQAKYRHQFNRPLADFPLVKQKLANIAGLTYAMDATTYLTAGFIDSHQEDIMLEAAILKVFASDSLWSILYDTMQIFGGRSFFTNYPLERIMRDSRLNMIGEGSNEVLRAFIGLVGMRDMGMELQSVRDALYHPFSNREALWRFAKSWIQRAYTPEVPVESSLLKIEARRLGKLVRNFGLGIVKLLATYREDILERQLQQNRIANVAIAIYTTTAVLSKLDTDLQTLQISQATAAAARLYCQQTITMAHRSLRAITSNRDVMVEKVSQLLIKEFE